MADISNILETTGLYQAQYIKLPAEDKPPGCNIPALLPGSLDLGPLPPISITNECATDFNVIPIIPTPYIPPVIDANVPCQDGFQFGGGITVRFRNAELAPENNTVRLVEANDSCGAQLDGEINFDLPNFCPNGINFTGQSRFLLNGQDTGQRITLQNLSNTSNCGAVLDGDFNLNMPQIRCTSGFAFGGSTKIKVNGVDQQGSITLTGSECGATLGGDINIPVPLQLCPNGFNFTGAGMFKVNGQTLVDENNQPQKFSFTRTTDCEFNLGGTVDFTIPELMCPSGFTYEGGISVKAGTTIILPNSDKNTITIKKKEGDDKGCGAVLQGQLELDIPNVLCPTGLSFGGSVPININGRTSSSAVALTPNTGSTQHCGAQLEGSINLSIPEFGGAYPPGTYVPPNQIVPYIGADGSMCSAISLQGHTATTSNGPGTSGGAPYWRTLGCDNLTAGIQFIMRHSFETFIHDGNKVRINLTSNISKDQNGELANIKGLGKSFTLAPNKLVYLELIFNPNDLKLPLWSANVCYGNAWDEHTTAGGDPNYKSCWPHRFKSLRPRDAAEEENPEARESMYTREEVTKYVELEGDPTKIEEVVDKIKNEILAPFYSAPYPNVHRHYKTYIILGKSLSDVTVDDRILIDNSDPANPKSYGFKQYLKQDLVLVNTTYNNLPVIDATTAVPYGEVKQVSKPTAIIDGGTVTLEVENSAVNGNSNYGAEIYYINSPVPLTTGGDNTNPSKDAIKYTAPFVRDPAFPVQAIAIKPTFISSAVLTVV